MRNPLKSLCDHHRDEYPTILRLLQDPKLLACHPMRLADPDDLRKMAQLNWLEQWHGFGKISHGKPSIVQHNCQY